MILWFQIMMMPGWRMMTILAALGKNAAIDAEIDDEEDSEDKDDDGDDANDYDLHCCQESPEKLRFKH